MESRQLYASQERVVWSELLSLGELMRSAESSPSVGIVLMAAEKETEQIPLVNQPRSTDLMAA